MSDTTFPGAYKGHETDGSDTRVPFAIQALSIIFFAGFAISVSVVAIDTFWPAGIALAAYFAYLWGRIPTLDGGGSIKDTVAALRPQAPAERPSGNASFDAYKSELLVRLEKEQTNFDTFLDRLRDARDKSEFERFLDDRAEAARRIDN